MRELERPIGRVWRRLRFQRFLAALVWCWAGCLVLTAVAIGVEKLAHRPIPGPDWAPFAGAGAVGLVAAALIALLTGPDRVAAAVAIDRSFHLNERLSTALTLPTDLRETPAGRALIADTVRHIDDLDIGSKFGLRLPRRAWVPLIPAAAAVGLLFVPELAQKVARANRVLDKVNQEALTKKAAALSKKISSKRQELDKNKFAEAEKLLAEIEKATKELAKAPPAEKDKALMELNKLADTLKERQKQLGNNEQVKRQLQQLKDLANDGPADEFAKSLANGDFHKAADQLKQLREKLASGKLTKEEEKKLQDQLGAMKKQLEKLANLEQRKKQLEEALKNGGLSQKQYEQEMAKLKEQSKGLESLQKLAQKLGEAQKQMANGNMQKAADALAMSQKQMEQMAQQLQEMQALDGAMADLQEAKDSLLGEGLNQLGQDMDGMNSLGQGNMNNGNPRMGLGRGRGQGDRPEAPDNTAAFNTKVKQQFTKGKAYLEGFGPPNMQMKSPSVIAAQAEEEIAAGMNAEALSNQKIPKSIQKHIQGYYDQINKKE